jgi:hypothetical protein
MKDGNRRLLAGRPISWEPQEGGRKQVIEISLGMHMPLVKYVPGEHDVGRRGTQIATFGRELLLVRSSWSAFYRSG